MRGHATVRMPDCQIRRGRGPVGRENGRVKNCFTPPGRAAKLTAV
jgi:hypothetical protein